MQVGRHEYSVLVYCHQGSCGVVASGNHRLEAGSLMLVPGWVAHRVDRHTPLSCLNCWEAELPLDLRAAITSVRLGASPVRALPERLWNGGLESLLALFLEDRREAPVWVHEALRLVFEHCSEPWSLPRLAEQVGVSPAHLTTQVRRWTGQSLGQWSLRARLDYAGLALRAGSASVAEVAAASGFTDLCHFRRLFRRQYQLSPQEYRSL